MTNQIITWDENNNGLTEGYLNTSARFSSTGHATAIYRSAKNGVLLANQVITQYTTSADAYEIGTQFKIGRRAYTQITENSIERLLALAPAGSDSVSRSKENQAITELKEAFCMALLEEI